MTFLKFFERKKCLKNHHSILSVKTEKNWRNKQTNAEIPRTFDDKNPRSSFDVKTATVILIELVIDCDAFFGHFCRKMTVLWQTAKFAAIKWKMPTLKELTMSEPEEPEAYLEAFLTTFWIRIRVVHMLDIVIFLPCQLELWLIVHRSQELQILH